MTAPRPTLAPPAAPPGLPRPWVPAAQLAELTAALAARDGAVTLVVGPRGAGKTTLLATWLARAADDDGASRASDYRSVFVRAGAPTSLTRALHQLAPVRSQPHRAGPGLRGLWCLPTEAECRTVFLDGLHARDGLAESLEWLPPRTHRGLRLVVTATTGAGEQLPAWRRSARCRLVQVRGVSDPEARSQLVRDALRSLALDLPEVALDIVVRQPGAANPLFAIVVAAELAHLGPAWWSRTRLSARFGSTAESAVSAALAAVEADAGAIGRAALRRLTIARGAAPPELLGADPPGFRTLQGPGHAVGWTRLLGGQGSAEEQPERRSGWQYG